MSATISITRPPRLIQSSAPGEASIVVPVPFPGRTRVVRQARRRTRHVAIMAAGTIAILVAAWKVTDSPLFGLKSLSIAGNHHVSDARVTSLGRLAVGTNVFWLSSSSVARRLESNPWVLDATVSHTFPGAVTVSIRERTPVAVLAGRSLLVSGDGMVLGKGRASRTLPTISLPGLHPPGSRIRNSVPALQVAGGLPPSLRPFVARITMAGGRAELTTRDGVRVLFGEPMDVELKAAGLQRVLSWARAHEVHAEYVDVRAPGAPALMPRGAAVRAGARSTEPLPGAALVQHHAPR